MPRKPKGLNKPIAKTAARMSRKAALTPAQLESWTPTGGLPTICPPASCTFWTPPAEAAP